MPSAERLPVEDIREDILGAARVERRFIVDAPTGSGKSTRVPGFLLDAGLLGTGRAVVLQPRRLAARMLAARVAQERGQALGAEVGYQVRFDHCAGAATRIVYETEGLLLRQWLQNPDLDGIQAILFDEFHERHLYGDVTLARALALQRDRRPDLILGVMSATLDVGPLQHYLTPCPVCTSQGRTYPVTVTYAPPRPATEPASRTAARAVEQWLQTDSPGDVLVFMPGAYEIGRTLRELENQTLSGRCLLLPLHGELSPAQQDAAVQTYDGRKIIVATNIAETSLTIAGVRLVVDSGLARVARFDPHRGINTLWIERISQASAEQRAGRAGRVAPGHCMRCWSEQEHSGRAQYDAPEIQRLDLAEAFLMLKAAGWEELAQFPWYEAPPARAWSDAERLLVDLGAIQAGKEGSITQLGEQMVAFPVHPRYARLLVEAVRHQCVRAGALVVAIAQGRPLWTGRATREMRERRHDVLGPAQSDFFWLIRAWNYARSKRYAPGACQPLGIHAQAVRQVEQVFTTMLRLADHHWPQRNHGREQAPTDDVLARCILAGFADRVAIQRSVATHRCEIVHGRKGRLAPDSALQDATLLVAAEIDEIERGGEGEVVLNNVTAIEEAWLADLFPHAMEETDQVEYDRRTKRVVASRCYAYHDLVLHRTAIHDPPRDEAAHLLAAECLQGHIPLHRWDASVDQWIYRVNYLARTCPDLGLPTIGADEKQLVIEQLCWGATTAKEVRDRAVWPVLKGLLSGGQEPLLARHAPEKIALSGTRPCRLTYGTSGPPVLAATIQDLLPVRKIPRIACGRDTPLLHILAPNRRPVQVTQDLAGFWHTHYPGLRQELKRRYPKHAWPEQPG